MARRLALILSPVLVLGFCSSALAAPPAASCAPACTPPLVKIGGATAVVQQTPNIDLIFWGSHWNSQNFPAHMAVKNAVSSMFFALSNNTGAATSYNNIMAQYLGTNYVPFYGGVWVDNNDPPATLKSSDFQAEVDRAIANVGMWSAGQNVQFMILPEETTTGGARVVVTFAGEEKPDLCGYHDYATGTANGTEIYDVDPWTGNIPGCPATYGNGTGLQQLISSMTTVATHEYAEAATDPFWNSTTGQKGWQTNQPAALYEIGDLCVYPGVNLPGVGAVQYLWSNAANAGNGACVT